MTDRPGPPPLSADAYSPHLRTAVVLTGTGTAGAYHAGVLRALDEAGVIDVVAGRGIGVVSALFAAIHGAERLWDDTGFWRGKAVESFYGWRLVVRVAGWALAASAAVVAVPIATMAVGLVVFPIDFVVKMVSPVGAAGLVGWYLRLTEAAFAPEALPTWLPRLVFLVLLSATLLAVASAVNRMRGRGRGPWWWRLVPSPLSAHDAASQCWHLLWDLVRGAGDRSEPQPTELGRRYVALLADNLGQPGFRELLIVTHDVDARRDLVFALVGEPRRRDLMRRATIEAAEIRRAEVFDLSGPAREHLGDAVAAAMAVPLATDLCPITFAPDSYWRGETHRLCDRPAALGRIVDELVEIGVEQLLMVSAAPEAEGPHALASPRFDGRARPGEYLQSVEVAAVRDATMLAVRSVRRVFAIRPAHNPIGPFDFSGGYDDRSDRPQGLSELLDRGYQDAYLQFIEPVVGASGDQLSAVQERQEGWRDR